MSNCYFAKFVNHVLERFLVQVQVEHIEGVYFYILISQETIFCKK
jgi:hypothetical protein